MSILLEKKIYHNALLNLIKECDCMRHAEWADFNDVITKVCLSGWCKKELNIISTGGKM